MTTTDHIIACLLEEARSLPFRGRSQLRSCLLAAAARLDRLSSTDPPPAPVSRPVWVVRSPAGDPLAVYLHAANAERDLLACAYPEGCVLAPARGFLHGEHWVFPARPVDDVP